MIQYIYIDRYEHKLETSMPTTSLYTSKAKILEVNNTVEYGDLLKSRTPLKHREDGSLSWSDGHDGV